VSGSLAYPAFLRGLSTVAGPGLRGFPSASASLGRSRERQPSNDLIVSFRALRRTLEPPCVGSSSPGIGVPAADIPPARPLPGASSHRTDAARCRFMFRPRGFAPPRRLSPRKSCGSVAPRNRSRVHRVSCMPAGGGAPEGGLDAGDSPRSAFRTLRRVSLVSSRTRITAAVAFLSLPSCPAGGSGRSRGPPTAIPADAGGVLL